MKKIDLFKQKEKDIYLCYSDPYHKGPTLLINNIKICLNYNQLENLKELLIEI
jgi:hypothetical protein